MVEKFRLIKFPKETLIKIGGRVIFILAFVVYMYCIYQIPLVRTQLPWLNNQIKAYRLLGLAKKLPPSSTNAIRFRAMAEALKNGSNDYTFEIGSIPALGQ